VTLTFEAAEVLSALDIPGRESLGDLDGGELEARAAGSRYSFRISGNGGQHRSAQKDYGAPDAE
jgi:hypothetical protein